MQRSILNIKMISMVNLIYSETMLTRHLISNYILHVANFLSYLYAFIYPHQLNTDFNASVYLHTLQKVHGHFNLQRCFSQLHVWSHNSWHWTDVSNVHNTIMVNLDILRKGLNDVLEECSLVHLAWHSSDNPYMGCLPITCQVLVITHATLKTLYTLHMCIHPQECTRNSFSAV